MSMPGLVAAYTSDSEEEETHEKEISLPPTKAENSSRSFVDRMGLPAPKKAAKTAEKRQILVETAPTIAPSQTLPVAKKPKLDPAAKDASHSLLGMLPAPQNYGAKPKPAPIEPQESVLDDDARLVIRDEKAVSKNKGNEDFRAMLGLAPKGPTDSKPKKAPVIVKETKLEASAPGPDMPTSSLPPPTRTTFNAAPEVRESKKEREPTPDVADDPYRGWKCDPDGTWYPVTPEAHAAYAAWVREHQSVEEARSLAQVPRHASLASFNAAEEMQRAQSSRPGDVSTASKPVQESLVSEKLRTDKFTNTRARSRGQLTSLLAMAHENKSALEERWAQGKSKMRENKKRYGF